MTKPFTSWTVLPHGKLTQIDDNLLSVSGVVPMPVGEVERRMTVVRLRDGRLVVYSAIALAEAEMCALEEFGTPAFLIVPSSSHRLDAKAWCQRYPNMMVITPAGARAKVEEVVAVDATTVMFDDPNVHFVVVAGTGEQEAALMIDSRQGTTLVLNDLIFNLDNQPGVRGWVMRVLGVTSNRPHIPRFIRRREVKDNRALREQLEIWSKLPSLRRVIMAHGNIINRNAARTLGRLAQTLAV